MILIEMNHEWRRGDKEILRIIFNLLFNITIKWFFLFLKLKFANTFFFKVTFQRFSRDFFRDSVQYQIIHENWSSRTEWITRLYSRLIIQSRRLLYWTTVEKKKRSPDQLCQFYFHSPSTARFLCDIEIVNWFFWITGRSAWV